MFDARWFAYAARNDETGATALIRARYANQAMCAAPHAKEPASSEVAHEPVSSGFSMRSRGTMSPVRSPICTA
ncbi:hypothetical protein B0G84_5967 [Paraburkholderia sp. BL8N3]|nr:hypothetical protein B0G84_5967 [Paraburkholderia sp. BL8N3]